MSCNSLYREIMQSKWHYISLKLAFSIFFLQFQVFQSNFTKIKTYKNMNFKKVKTTLVLSSVKNSLMQLKLFEK